MSGRRAREIRRMAAYPGASPGLYRRLKAAYRRDTRASQRWRMPTGR